MANWDRVKELTEESANAAGTADEKYTAYMESMEAATKRLQNAWEGFTQSLETSTVMKFLTNSVALLVENADKLKYLITVFAAASSARIFDFFTNKGETGGWKGLIANIPFIGRGTKTNNILESIDKKVGNIEKGVGADSLANQTKNGGLISRIKTGFQQRGADKKLVRDNGGLRDADISFIQNYEGGKFDKLNLTSDEQFEYYKHYLKLKQTEGNISDASARLAADKAMRARSFKQTAILSGIATAATQSLTTKQVSGYGQTVEETGGDKALRTGLATAGSVAGAASALIPVVGPMIAPIVSSLGSIAGEGLAGLISKWFHKDELQMKQRVQEAKENLQALDSVKSTIESGNSIVSQELATSDDYTKLKEYTDNLSDVLYDYASDYDSEILDNIKNGLKEAGFDTSKIQTISDLCNQINEGNVEQRKLIQQQIDIELARKTLEETKKSYEADLADISTSEFKFKSWGFNKGGAADDEITSLLKGAGFKTHGSFSDFLRDVSDSTGGAGNALLSSLFNTSILGYAGAEIVGNSLTNISADLNNMDIYDAQAKIQNILKENKEVLSDTAKTALEQYNQQLEQQIAKYEKIGKEIREQRVNLGLLESGVQDFTEREISEWGLEGLIMKVAQATENATSSTGRIKDEYYSAIKSAIKADSHFNTLLKQNGETILDLTRQQDTFSKYLEGQIELSEKDKAAVEGVKKTWEAWYDLAMRGKLSDELAKVVLAANPERIKLFANAWNMTVEEAKKLADELPGLTTALGLMTPSEVLDYYTNLSDIFSDLSDNAKLTAKNFDEIISKYPKLMALYGKGDKNDLQANILKTLGVEQKTAYLNALTNEFLSGEGYVSLLEKGVGGNDDSWITSIESKDTQKEIYTALQSKSMRELKETLDFWETQGTESQKAAAQAINKQIENVYGGTKEIEFEDPYLQYLKTGFINQQDKIIKNLEEQKDALGKINDERKKEIELIKARDALENAKKEKVRVYRAGVGWTYEANEEAISQAQENLDNLDTQKRQEDLQYQIDVQQQLKDIVENLETEREIEAGIKSLNEWMTTNGYTGASGMASAIIEGFGNKLIKWNPLDKSQGSGEQKIDLTDISQEQKKEVDEYAKDLSELRSNIPNKPEFGTEGNETIEKYNKNVEAYRDAYKAYDTKKQEIQSKGYGDELLKKMASEEGYTSSSGNVYKAGNLVVSEEDLPKFKQGIIEIPYEELNIDESSINGKISNSEAVSGGSKNGNWSGVLHGDEVREKMGDLTPINGKIAYDPEEKKVYVYMDRNYETVEWRFPKGRIPYMETVTKNQKGWFNLTDAGGVPLTVARNYYQTKYGFAQGTESFQGGQTLINELGTEAVITPGGTLTALPSKTGIVPADITRNVWALGEVAPTLVAQLGSLTQKTLSGNAGNTTYEEGQYFDNFTMNVYPAKGDDFNKILEQARAQMRLTRHNN